MINFINARKDEGQQPKDLGGELDPFRRQLVHIYASYQQECQRASLVDFGELLLRVYLLWRKMPICVRIISSASRIFWWMNFKTQTPFNTLGSSF